MSKLLLLLNTIKQKFYVIPACILVVFAITGLFTPFISTYSPEDISLLNRLIPPLSTGTDKVFHLLGTDILGRDYLSRIMYGAMIPFKATVIILIINAVAGSAVGICSGYLGGWIDNILMRITDMAISIPWMVVVIVSVLLMGISMTAIIMAMTLFGWANLARTLRVEAMRLKYADFVLQARINGCSFFRIILIHILPNLLNTIVILAVMSIPYIILTEGMMSYLKLQGTYADYSLGIQTLNPSWGTMINEGRNFIYSAWWIPFFPAFAIGLVVYSSMYLGDWLRDRLDPKITDKF